MSFCLLHNWIQDITLHLEILFLKPSQNQVHNTLVLGSIFSVSFASFPPWSLLRLTLTQKRGFHWAHGLWTLYTSPGPGGEQSAACSKNHTLFRDPNVVSFSSVLTPGHFPACTSLLSSECQSGEARSCCGCRQPGNLSGLEPPRYIPHLCFLSIKAH